MSLLEHKQLNLDADETIPVCVYLFMFQRDYTKKGGKPYPETHFRSAFIPRDQSFQVSMA